jgi:hypothetical protein
VDRLRTEVEVGQAVGSQSRQQVIGAVRHGSPWTIRVGSLLHISPRPLYRTLDAPRAAGAVERLMELDSAFDWGRVTLASAEDA